MATTLSKNVPGLTAAQATELDNLEVTHQTVLNSLESTLQHDTVQVSSADLLALYSAPKLLIDPPGAGHSTAIAKVIFAITRTSTVYVTGGGAAIIQYDSTTHGGGTQACDSTIAATVITGTAGLSITIRNGAVISDSSGTDNKGIYLSAATGDFTLGTGTAVVDIWYYQS
jgi:hypothetical protein